MWDDKLASYAANWAQKCKFVHSNGKYGENLWMSTDSKLNDCKFLLESYKMNY